MAKKLKKLYRINNGKIEVGHVDVGKYDPFDIMVYFSSGSYHVAEDNEKKFNRALQRRKLYHTRTQAEYGLIVYFELLIMKLDNELEKTRQKYEKAKAQYVLRIVKGN